MRNALVVTTSLGAALLLLATAGPGCGDNKGSNGVGAIGGAGGDTPAGTGGAGCSTIANIGATVTQVQASGALPQPLGGTIADGTYVLTKDEAYPPVSVGVPFHSSQTLEIAGALMNVALVSDEFPAGLKGTANLVTSGTVATITWLCGGNGTFDEGYTATATELVLIAPQSTVHTYTKQ
jgi:hypothetical protein